MRHWTNILVAALLASLAAPASAQFGGLEKLLPAKITENKAVKALIDNKDNLANATKEPTEAEEIAIGDEFAATLLGAKPLDPDARLQRYVNVLGLWLAQQTERPDLPWAFGVLADPGFNAFATPGGRIFVTRGLVDRMRNEAELAGVLAHEIAHVLKKHHLNAVRTGGVTGIAAYFAEQKAASTRYGELKTALLGNIRNIFAKGLDKSDEFEADRMGIVIAARAGFDPYGLPAVLQMLQTRSGEDGAFSLLFKTHPAPAARIEMLERLMDQRFEGLALSTGKTVAERLNEFGK